MFISRCISLLLSATMTTSSIAMWVGPMQYDIAPTPEIPSEPVIEEIIDEPVVEIPEEVVEEDVPATPDNGLPFTDEEIDLIALVTMGEAEGEPEEGKRLVIDVILNRIDSTRFADNVEGVIYAKNAFECMWNGRINRCYVRDDIRQLVIEEINSRTNSNIHYFRTKHYHIFGKPVVSVGNHYFSTY